MRVAVERCLQCPAAVHGPRIMAGPSPPSLLLLTDCRKQDAWKQACHATKCVLNHRGFPSRSVKAVHIEAPSKALELWGENPSPTRRPGGNVNRRPARDPAFIAFMALSHPCRFFWSRTLAVWVLRPMLESGSRVSSRAGSTGACKAVFVLSQSSPCSSGTSSQCMPSCQPSSRFGGTFMPLACVRNPCQLSKKIGAFNHNSFGSVP